MSDYGSYWKWIIFFLGFYMRKNLRNLNKLWWIRIGWLQSKMNSIELKGRYHRGWYPGQRIKQLLASNGYSGRNWMKVTLLWGARSYWLLKVTLKQKYRVWNICTSGKTWGYQGFLEFTAHLVYKIYQLNVKCSFLNGELVEEFSSTTVLRLWNSKSCGLCISTLQDSQQA